MLFPNFNFFVQGIGNALKWVKEMTEAEEELNEKVRFLGGFVSAFKDHIHTDINVKPGDFGPSIPAHRALLVTPSKLSLIIINSV